jgi:hypothetical protein
LLVLPLVCRSQVPQPNPYSYDSGLTDPSQPPSPFVQVMREQEELFYAAFPGARAAELRKKKVRNSSSYPIPSSISSTTMSRTSRRRLRIAAHQRPRFSINQHDGDIVRSSTTPIRYRPSLQRPSHPQTSQPWCALPIPQATPRRSHELLAPWQTATIREKANPGVSFLPRPQNRMWGASARQRRQDLQVSFWLLPTASPSLTPSA